MRERVSGSRTAAFVAQPCALAVRSGSSRDFTTRPSKWPKPVPYWRTTVLKVSPKRKLIHARLRDVFTESAQSGNRPARMSWNDRVEFVSSLCGRRPALSPVPESAFDDCNPLLGKERAATLSPAERSLDRPANELVRHAQVGKKAAALAVSHTEMSLAESGGGHASAVRRGRNARPGSARRAPPSRGCGRSDTRVTPPFALISPSARACVGLSAITTRHSADHHRGRFGTRGTIGRPSECRFTDRLPLWPSLSVTSGSRAGKNAEAASLVAERPEEIHQHNQR